MESIYWDLSGFNLYMSSGYDDLYQLEQKFDLFYGSSNFSAIDTLDWFLLDKNSHKISFVLLTVNAAIELIEGNQKYPLIALEKINFKNIAHYFINNVEITKFSRFYRRANQLLSFSMLSSIKYKVLISDQLYFLLDDEFAYQGFILENATHHINGFNKNLNSPLFDDYLKRMFYFCTENSYEKMDEKDNYYLSMLNNLEASCDLNKHKDKRIENITEFIQLLKFNFYNIDC